jgi:hypothetical protein
MILGLQMLGPKVPLRPIAVTADCWAVYLAPVGRRVEEEVEETVGAPARRVSAALS